MTIDQALMIGAFLQRRYNMRPNFKVEYVDKNSPREITIPILINTNLRRDVVKLEEVRIDDLSLFVKYLDLANTLVLRDI